MAKRECPFVGGRKVRAALSSPRGASSSSRLRAELRTRAHQQAVVVDLGRRALEGVSIQTLMDEAVVAVASTLDVEYSKVLQLLPGDEQLLLRSGVGWHDGLVGRCTLTAKDRSQAGYTLLVDAPVVVPDLRRETRFSGPRLLLDHGVVSGISVVIKGLTGPFGVLGAHTSRRRAFSQDDINFAQAVANLLGTAVERSRAEEAVRFLLEAGSVLSSSLDYETTLRSVARLAVPRVADWCAVDLLRADGSINRVSVAHVDPAKVRLAEEVAERYPVNPTDQYGVANVLRTGRSELYSQIDEALLARSARDPEHLEISRALGMRSAMVVPLVARGRTLGAITLVAAESGRHYGQADLSFAQDLAARAAQAVDNALLFREAREALSLRDDFLYAITHDLRNPLGAIKGYAQLLQRQVVKLLAPEADRFLDGLQAIDLAATRMVSQIEELVDLARLQAGQPLELRRKPFDLVALANQIAVEQQPGNEAHRIVFKGSAAELVGEWDPVRVERVLGNLLSNAIKYSPEGGEVEVSVSEERDAAGVWAVLRVTDHGLGIPAEDLPRIFERFTRGGNVKSTIGGTGIGLASVYQIVAQHGGTISAESVEGKGSSFYVRLPLTPALADAPDGTPPAMADPTPARG